MTRILVLLTLLFSAVSASADILSVSIQPDKQAAKPGELVNFTCTVSNTSRDETFTLVCSVSYTDPSTGVAATTSSNAVTLTRLGFTVLSPILKIAVVPYLDILLGSFTIDGSPIPAVSDGTSVSAALPNISPSQSKVVKFQARAK
jgi:uncharacterized repeat protein (TIGR01451 family)